MTSPIFFDSSGRRRRLVGRIAGLLLIVILCCAAAFATTIVDVPTASPLDFGHEREQPLPFLTHVARLRHHLPRLPHLIHAGRLLHIGFYIPQDDESAASLRMHYDQLDWIVASDATIDLNRGRMIAIDDPRLRSIGQNHIHRPQFLMMVQNLVGGAWFGPAMASILRNRRASDRLAAGIVDAVKKRRWQGVVFDFENLPASAQPAYQSFLARNHNRFRGAGLTVAVTVPAGLPGPSLRRFALTTDHVILMNYDQHWQGGEPGPIAAQDWFADNLAQARASVPASKLIVALGSYGYDWHDGKADALTIDEAWLAAHDSDTKPTFDPVSGNSGFAFEDNGHKHMVWMMDAATSWNELVSLDHVAGIALWRLGSEDSGFWEALQAMEQHRLPQLDLISPAQGTDVEGTGEILRIGSASKGGRRVVQFDANRNIVGESFTDLPTPFVVQRTGASDPHNIALTFDDGPDPDYTPPILATLERMHVPATFFVIGENALEHPAIMHRIIRDGDEIGNHSYTHPNMAEISPLGVMLELNATQRLIEAYTGRSTRLFRAPYFGDAEPTTADELGPAMLAQQRGYTIVGLHIDSEDWRLPGVGAIIGNVLTQIHSATPEHSGNIVLLHDGGGPRNQTIRALPLLIERLQSQGYRFVTVSQLAGLTRDAVMPPVTGRDLLAVRADVGLFAIISLLDLALRWTFFFAIALGIGRAIFMTLLSLIDAKATTKALRDAAQPPVSVIIPAYNEEKVIVASVARVLASDYPALQLIIADDGSKDATSQLVSAHYGDDPRVRLLTLQNGGKASALNRALVHATGSIVIALDADTQFLPDTVAKLVRWFADPSVGAVAGNARVGNRVNLVTRWQAIEYVTSQNVERRALDALGAITVVPGAVGAWRRDALDDVGGYPEDTLAEDQDLTIAIQRKGWRVAYDTEAVALTEAPETLRALGRQRYRWSFGTLQCLWKHRTILRTGRPRGLAWFGIPQAWLFQIIFAALSPIIDLALVTSMIGTYVRVHQHGWAQTQSDVLRMGAYWIAFVTIDVGAGWIAYRLDPKRERFPAMLMIMQRFVYRQLMYGVVLRSISSALRGRGVGWGKLERTGTVSATEPATRLQPQNSGQYDAHGHRK